MVEELTDYALDQDRSIEHSANVKSDDQVVRDSQVHFLVFNLELMGQSALLDIVLDDPGDSCQDNERLSELLGLNWRNQIEVCRVKPHCQDWVHSGIEERVFKLILDAEGRAYSLGCVLCNLELAKLEGDLG